MEQEDWYKIEATRTLARILPRIEGELRAKCDEGSALAFISRLEVQFPRFFRLLHILYGSRYDFFYHLQDLCERMAQAWIERPEELKALDASREEDPSWFISSRMVAAMCYVDLFCDTIEGLKATIPYLKELSVTYLHLMPIFSSPEGDDDGGYAMSSYREINPQFGDMEQLRELTKDFRAHGISLCLDFVFNHTSDEHTWAKQSLRGSAEYQQYYRMFSDRQLPDQYEKNLQEIFPDEHPGAFSYRPKLRKWVWTTFHTYQWDLNYENPSVFLAMAEEMLFLANIGVEIVRLDAIAFIWKRLGTSCENLPEAHYLVQAFNAVLKVVAPGTVFKSEAIVHPDEVAKYVSEDECQLSYSPNLMALLWSTLATRDVTLLTHSLNKRFAIPKNCAWVNFVRCHDDIGWAFSNEDAAEVGVNGNDHRKFLNAFYTGDFAGSFARGLPFQYSEKTGDMRISGSCASLCGLEVALEQEDKHEIELAVRRILILHSVILTIGGIPLLYLGDEIGTLNDYTFLKDHEKFDDSRWVHRPYFDWHRAEGRTDSESVQSMIFTGILRLLQVRSQNRAFERGQTEFVHTGNRHVFGFFRVTEEQSVLVLFNFSERMQEVQAGPLRQRGMKKVVTDLLAGRTFTALNSIELESYQCMVLAGIR